MTDTAIYLLQFGLGVGVTGLAAVLGAAVGHSRGLRDASDESGREEWDKGYGTGYVEGHGEGYERGKEDGHEDGYAEGYKDGNARLIAELADKARAYSDGYRKAEDNVRDTLLAFLEGTYGGSKAGEEDGEEESPANPDGESLVVGETQVWEWDALTPDGCEGASEIRAFPSTLDDGCHWQLGPLAVARTFDEIEKYADTAGHETPWDCVARLARACEVKASCCGLPISGITLADASGKPQARYAPNGSGQWDEVPL